MFIVEGFIIMLLLPVLVPYVLYLVVRNLNPFSREARGRRFLKKSAELDRMYWREKSISREEYARRERELRDRYRDILNPLIP